MAKSKHYQKRGSKVVVEPNDEHFSDIEKQEKIVYWEILEMDRENFIKHLLKVSDIIDKQLSEQTEDSRQYDLSRSKNTLQSLAYLILNDTFYREIARIRKKLKIPHFGFQTGLYYKKWATACTKKYDLNYKLRGLRYAVLEKDKVSQSKDAIYSYGYERVYREAERLVKKHKLANKRDASILATIIASFITRRLKFDSFLQKVVPFIYENHNSYLVGGFDVIVKELPLSSKDFYKCQWVVKLYLFCNKTGIGYYVKDYFEREIIHKKNEKSYDRQYVRIQIKKLNINQKKWERKPRLEIKDRKGIVALRFTTDFFTKPSQIISLYNDSSARIKAILEKKEASLMKIQKRNLGRNFTRNYSMYKMYKKGIPYDIIYDDIYGVKSEPGSESLNTSKGEIGEFQSHIRDSIKRKIVF
jgi:hypothetical protein